MKNYKRILASFMAIAMMTPLVLTVPAFAATTANAGTMKQVASTGDATTATVSHDTYLADMMQFITINGDNQFEFDIPSNVTLVANPPDLNAGMSALTTFNNDLSQKMSPMDFEQYLCATYPSMSHNQELSIMALYSSSFNVQKATTTVTVTNDNFKDVLTPYITVTGENQFLLSIPTTVHLTASAETMYNVYNALGHANQMLQSSDLTANTDGSISDPNVSSSQSPKLLGAYQGWNGAYVHWWGFTCYLDNYWCNQICTGATVGRIAAGVASSNPALAPVAIPVAMALGAYKGVISYHNHGRGIGFNWVWGGPVISVWSQ